MPVGRIAAAIAFSWLLFSSARVLAQYQPPSDFLNITGDQASLWADGSTNIIQIQGPVTIQTDRAKMTAQRAVIWLTPMPQSVLDHQRVEIALLGKAELEMPQVSRSGDSLFITTEVRGAVRLTAQKKSNQNLSDSDLYRDASAMRPLVNAGAGALSSNGQWISQRPWVFPPPPAPTSAPTTQAIRPKQSVSIKAENFKTFQTSDNKTAALAWGGVTIVWIEPKGDVLQMQAENVVLFTGLSSAEEVPGANPRQAIADVANAVYLEGDVRIIQTSTSGKVDSEQRLRAQRVYYDLTTDRAVLTDAVVHMIEPKSQIPLIVRAQLVRQLSRGEYRAQDVTLSTSSFRTPSYGIYSDRAYVREYDTGDPRLGQRTDFEARDTLFDVQGVPIFYWPWAAGSVTERGFPLRSVQTGTSRGLGPGIRTHWGMFESLGIPPPEDLDLSYHLDYFGDRGPAGGIDSTYQGGFITDTTKQPWNFNGDFTSYIISDHGTDRLGRDRSVDPEDDLRYHFLWTHQHYVPDDWQIQLRAGYVSDPTFLEEWFKDQFTDGDPHDVSAYFKRQRGTEALTLGANGQPSGVVTTSDMLQEGFEVERLPQLGYQRIGDSFADDKLTFFSSNTAEGLHFKTSRASPADLGFKPGQSPGLPSLGQTGTTDDTTYRGDWREEVDYPFDVGKFRVVPYVFGRYTVYSDSPSGSSQDRFFFGTGLRLTTSFWKVDNSARNDLLDIHRLRHIVEPEVNLFTSAQTTDRSDLFIYDEPVDAINDVSAIQLALHQRWQTKRGGAGQWHSADLFALNVEGNFFANQPSDPQLTPTDFRGLYFPSLPEASIPRNSINADALWRVSDTTAVLSDAQYNLDQKVLATTSVGLAVQRDERMSYFVGARYIDPLDSVIASLATDYELTLKYSIRLAQSFNISERRNQNTAVTLIRKFDRYFMTFSVYYDPVEDESGFRIGIYPEGLRYGVNTDQVNRALAY